MPRIAQQPEYRWTSWLRLFRADPPTREKSSLPKDAGLTAWCVEKAANLGLTELSRRLLVSWNPRMQTTAGRAWWPDRAIELNPKLRECGDEEVWRTLKHELAHLVAYERNMRRRIEPHGPEWRAACAELGIPNELPYHTLPFKRRSPKRNHAYICPQCQCTILRVKPIRRSVACYSCCRKYNHGYYDNRFRLVKLPA